MRGIGTVAMLFERRPRGIERVHRPIELAGDERDLGFGDDAASPGDSFFGAKGACCAP